MEKISEAQKRRLNQTMEKAAAHDRFGPAFPFAVSVDQVALPGMSLRQYAAIHAPTEELQQPNKHMKNPDRRDHFMDQRLRWADAVLAKSAKGGEE